MNAEERRVISELRAEGFTPAMANAVVAVVRSFSRRAFMVGLAIGFFVGTLASFLIAKALLR